ncbi:hypothetical protein [Streptomyces sp. NPDC005303]|uniref:hypothetical protein n=1 Tax=Streptomyces sp. NPDC005303 TaxID=3155713 RepID=UPI0033B30559
MHEVFYLRRDGTVTEEAKDVVEVGLTKAVSPAYDRVRMRFIASVDGEPEAGHLATAAGVSTETAAGRTQALPAQALARGLPRHPAAAP